MLGSSTRSRQEREENRNERSSAGTLVAVGMAFVAGYLLGARRGSGGGGSERMQESLETVEQVADTDREPAEIDIGGQGSAEYEGENVDVQAQREGGGTQVDAEYEGDDVEADAEYDDEGVDVEAEYTGSDGEDGGDQEDSEGAESSGDEGRSDDDDASGTEDGS